MSLSPSLDPDKRAPLPVLAHCTLPAYDFEVFFDKPLRAGSITGRNWRLHRNKRLREGSVVSVRGDRVQGSTIDDGATLAREFVQYLAMPPDLFGLNGFAVEPFDDFPLT